MAIVCYKHNCLLQAPNFKINHRIRDKNYNINQSKSSFKQESVNERFEGVNCADKNASVSLIVYMIIVFTF